MKKYKVTLTQEERLQLEAMSKTGTHQAQKITHAKILLACDEGAYQTKRTINKLTSQVLQVSMKTIDRVKKRFVEEGFDAALSRQPSQRVRPRKADGDLEARLIALSCSPAPEGYARWTLRLLANKAVALNYVESLSYETVRRVLKKTSLNHGNKKVG